MIKKLVEEFESVEKQLIEEMRCHQEIDTIKELDLQIQEIYNEITSAPVNSSKDKEALILFHLDRLCAANDQAAQSIDVLNIKRIIKIETPPEDARESDWNFDHSLKNVSNIA